MKKTFSIILCASMLFAAGAGCAPASSGSSSGAGSSTAASSTPASTPAPQAATDAVIELSLADAQPDGCACNMSLKAFVEEVNEKSGGSIKVTYYPNSQLGNERDLAEGVMAGTIDMAWVSCAVMQNFEESFSIFSLPFIFKDYEHVHAYANSELGQKIFNNLNQSSKVKVLGLFDQGFRWIWTKGKEVKTLTDLSGLKIRTPESDVYTKTFSLLGTNPTPMAFGDLFTALQTGVVAGYEVNPESTWTNGTYEAISNGVKSNHIFAGSVMFISQSSYDKLSEEQKKILDEASANAVNYNNQLVKENESKFEKQLTDAGLSINDLAEGEQEKFAAAVQPLYESYYDMVGGKEYVESVQNMTY